MIKTNTILTSIIALTFLIGITANVNAADTVVKEGTVVDGDGEFHAWSFTGTDGTSSLVATLVCGNTANPSQELDPVILVQSPSILKFNDDGFTPCDSFSSSIVTFNTGEVEDGCWATQSRGFGGDTGPYTLTLDLSGPGSIRNVGETDSLQNCANVAGENLPLDTTALLIAGAQTNAVWMFSALAVIGSVAFGALYVTSKKN